MAGVKADRAFTGVRWQVARCDLIWQVTLRVSLRQVPMKSYEHPCYCTECPSGAADVAGCRSSCVLSNVSWTWLMMLDAIGCWSLGLVQCLLHGLLRCYSDRLYQVPAISQIHPTVSIMPNAIIARGCSQAALGGAGRILYGLTTSFYLLLLITVRAVATDFIVSVGVFYVSVSTITHEPLHAS